MTKENDQLYAPDGYALISIEALKEWGKYEFVRDACQYPCQKMVPLSAYKELSALCTRQGIRLMELEDAQPEPEPEAKYDPVWCIEYCKSYAEQLRDKTRANRAVHAAECIEYLLSLANKEWVGLTDEEIKACAKGGRSIGISFHDAIRKAEAKLKEKNGMD